MLAAARRGLPVALHTPSEVKAAVTGNGRADKAQVDRDGDPAAAARRARRSRPTPPTRSRWPSATSGAAARPPMDAAAAASAPPPRTATGGRPMIASSAGAVAAGWRLDAAVVEVGGVGLLVHAHARHARRAARRRAGPAGHLPGGARGLADAVRVRRRRRAGHVRAAADGHRGRAAAGPGDARGAHAPTRCAGRSPPATWRRCTKVPGIGQKGAQRIVLELKRQDRRCRSGAGGAVGRPAPAGAWRGQVREALVGLGWTARQADDAVAAGSRASAGRRRPPTCPALLRRGAAGRWAGEHVRRTTEALTTTPRWTRPPGSSTPDADDDERAVEAALRPRRLAEFVGQTRVRDQLDWCCRPPGAAARAAGPRPAVRPARASARRRWP